MTYDQQLRPILARRPRGLLTDIDGTISPIAPTPGASRVSPAAQHQLRILAQQLDLVGAVSGRAAADAAAMVGLAELVYIGNHGMELWEAGISQPTPEAQPYVETIATVLREAEARLQLPGILFENKGVTASVHYRLAAEPEQAGAVVGAVLETLATQYGLRLTAGRFVWELRPPLAINKGTAVQQLVAQRGLRGVIFLGDDRTDTDAFRALRELQQQGSCESLSVGVVGADTPPMVRELADIVVEGVTGVEQLLAQIAELVARQDDHVARQQS